ncbi:MAG TPA: hypothetical protein VF766_06755 [Pyrinomonadaceae bacterium]
MKRCPACQRTYTDDTLSYCLEDGSALYNSDSGSADLAATLIIPEPRMTAPVKQETYRPTPEPPRPFTAQPPTWPSPVGALTPQALLARPGRGAAVTSLVLALSAFALLGFCIVAGASKVEETLIGGIFLFSVLLALVGAVVGIIAISRSSKDAGAQNPKPLAIVSLALNGLYLLITIIFLIIGAVAGSD